MNPLIKEYFFDYFEDILDELLSLLETKDSLIENEPEFKEVIEHQTYDEFIRSVSISCSTKLGLPYSEVIDALENNLEELFETYE